MRLWLKELIEDPVSLATIYSGLVILVMLWAMALLSRRVRATQAHLDALRGEVQVINEALRTVTAALQAHAAARGPAEPAAQGALSDEELSAMPPIL